MLNFFVRRLLLLIPTWLAVGVLAFTVIHMTPGDPAAVMLGPDSTQGIEQVRERLGLNRPISVQLVSFLSNAVRGDLGESFFLGRPVTTAIIERIPVTFELAFLAITIALLLGIPLGIVAALKPNTPRDTSVMLIALLGLSIPEFLTGLMLIFFFAVTYSVFPSGGYVPLSEGVVPWFRHMIMPAFALGFMQSAYIARMMRSSMLDVLASDYVRTANAKGLKGFVVVWKHAFKNALVPVITVSGLVFAMLLSGAFITEVLFRLPGIGTLVVSAVRRRDYPVVQGGLIFIATIILVINLLVDMLYAFIDPRIRYE